MSNKIYSNRHYDLCHSSFRKYDNSCDKIFSRQNSCKDCQGKYRLITSRFEGLDNNVFAKELDLIEAFLPELLDILSKTTVDVEAPGNQNHRDQREK